MNCYEKYAELISGGKKNFILNTAANDEKSWSRKGIGNHFSGISLPETNVHLNPHAAFDYVHIYFLLAFVRNMYECK